MDEALIQAELRQAADHLRNNNIGHFIDECEEAAPEGAEGLDVPHDVDGLPDFSGVVRRHRT